METARGDSLRGARLLVLRDLEGLTQAELASRLNVTQAFVSQVEKGLKPLPVEIARGLASDFQLPLEFFSVPPRLTDEGVPTFRKKANSSVRLGRRITRAFDEAARLFDMASASSDYRPAEFDDLREFDEEATARNVRQVLGLADESPILNATRSVERLGVGVVHDLVDLNESCGDHVGISRPNPYVNRPLVATIGRLPAAVARLTVMHELGHVVFDRDRTTPTTRSQEDRAFRFAASMLMPEPVIRRMVTDTLTLQGYLRVKAALGVSVSAIIMRAAHLGVISSERKRTLFIQLSSLGWRRNEPVAVADEEAILLGQAVARSMGANVKAISRKTGVRVADVERWTGLQGQDWSNVVDLQELRSARSQVRSEVRGVLRK